MSLCWLDPQHPVSVSNQTGIWSGLTLCRDLFRGTNPAEGQTLGKTNPLGTNPVWDRPCMGQTLLGLTHLRDKPLRDEPYTGQTRLGPTPPQGLTLERDAPTQLVC